MCTRLGYLLPRMQNLKFSWWLRVVVDQGGGGRHLAREALEHAADIRVTSARYWSQKLRIVKMLRLARQLPHSMNH